MTDAPIIEAQDVEFSYGPSLPAVLRKVSFRVREGEFVALLGQNGAGKTTLAKLFNGLHRPTSGRVSIGGRPVAQQTLHDIARTVGYCYQNPDHQIFSASVEKEVAFGPRNLGYSPDRVEQLVEHALELVGLADNRSAHPFSLGRGQRQLLAVASVIAMDPPVLVIDEPTTGMDRVGATKIMRLLAEWAAAGRSIVAITHDMDIVSEYIPRVVVMAKGEILADGETQEVFRQQEVLQRAHLLAPAPIVISDRLAPYGVRRSTSIEDAAEAVIERVRCAGMPDASTPRSFPHGGVDARRVQRLP